MLMAIFSMASKQEIVKKGWYKYGLLPLFDSYFQKKAWFNNMKIPLFKQEANKTMEMERNINYGEEETNAEKTIEKVMIESLIRILKNSQLGLCNATHNRWRDFKNWIV